MITNNYKDYKDYKFPFVILAGKIWLQTKPKDYKFSIFVTKDYNLASLIFVPFLARFQKFTRNLLKVKLIRLGTYYLMDERMVR